MIPSARLGQLLTTPNTGEAAKLGVARPALQLESIRTAAGVKGFQQDPLFN